MSWVSKFWEWVGWSITGRTELDRSRAALTPRANTVLELAEEEARQLRHNFIGTEHVLLGLVRFREGGAVETLRQLKVPLERVRKEVKGFVGLGPPDFPLPDKIPFTPRVQRVIVLAAREAKALGQAHVDTEHLLLGLLREGEGVGARVLRQQHVDLDQTRRAMFRQLDPDCVPADEPWKALRDLDVSQAFPDLAPRFSARSTLAIKMAVKTALNLDQITLTPEDLLDGILSLQCCGMSVKALECLNVSVDELRARLEKVSAANATSPKETTPIAERTRNVITAAAKEADRLGHARIDAGHLLLGILLDEGGSAGKLLKVCGLEIERLREEIRAEPESPQLQK